ncbi:hypothetical protein B6N31_07430 [Dickeya fangzhongdai]|nr:hypothetical protein B6N31_07430 [Dickeya fangzhongdai]
MVYTRHTSSCRCVGCPRSPRSLTYVSSRGFTRLPPFCNPNYFGYRTYRNRQCWDPDSARHPHVLRGFSHPNRLCRLRLLG